MYNFINNMTYNKLFTFKLNQLFVKFFSYNKSLNHKFNVQMNSRLLMIFMVVDANKYFNNFDYEAIHKMSESITSDVAEIYINKLILTGVLLLLFIFIIIFYFFVCVKLSKQWLNRRFDELGIETDKKNVWKNDLLIMLQNICLHFKGFGFGFMVGSSVSFVFMLSILSQVNLIMKSIITGQYALRTSKFVSKAVEIARIKNKDKILEVFNDHGSTYDYVTVSNVIKNFAYDVVSNTAHQMIFELMLLSAYVFCIGYIIYAFVKLGKIWYDLADKRASVTTGFTDNEVKKVTKKIPSCAVL